MKRTAVRRVNRGRKEKRWAEAFNCPEYVEWLTSWPCVVPHCCRFDIECAHVTSRAAGGTWRDTVPLCSHHHAEQHAKGIATFQKEHGIDLTREAALMQKYWENDPRDMAF